MASETDTTLSDDIDCEEGHVTQYPSAKSLILWFLVMVGAFLVLGGLVKLIIYKYSAPPVAEKKMELEELPLDQPLTVRQTGLPAQASPPATAEVVPARSSYVSTPRVIVVGRHTQKSFLVPGGGESPIIEIQDADKQFADFCYGDQRFIEGGKADPFTVRWYGTGDSVVGEHRYPEDGRPAIKTNRFSLIARGGRETTFVVSVK